MRHSTNFQVTFFFIHATFHKFSRLIECISIDAISTYSNVCVLLLNNTVTCISNLRVSVLLLRFRLGFLKHFTNTFTSTVCKRLICRQSHLQNVLDNYPQFRLLVQVQRSTNLEQGKQFNR